MRRKQVTGLGWRAFNFSFNKLNVICYANWAQSDKEEIYKSDAVKLNSFKKLVD